MLADDARDDDTASHVSDESFGEIDKHLDYEPEDGKASPAIIEDATTTANEGILNVAMEVGTEATEQASQNTTPREVTVEAATTATKEEPTSTSTTTNVTRGETVESTSKGARAKTRSTTAATIKITLSELRQGRQSNSTGKSPTNSTAYPKTSTRLSSSPLKIRARLGCRKKCS